MWSRFLFVLRPQEIATSGVQPGDAVEAGAPVRPRYLAATWRDEGRYAVLAGSSDEARKALKRYLALRAQPDLKLLDEVERVRGELASTSNPTP